MKSRYIFFARCRPIVVLPTPIKPVNMIFFSFMGICLFISMANHSFPIGTPIIEGIGISFNGLYSLIVYGYNGQIENVKGVVDSMSDSGLESLRSKLDDINYQILDLISKRAKIVEEIGVEKQKHGVPRFDPVRES